MSTATVVVPAPVGKKLSETEKSAIKKRHYDAAFKHYQKGGYELAIAGWEEVLKIDPNHKESKNRIVLAKQKLKEKKGVIK